MRPSYNIIFMGTPDFAVPALNALIQSRHKVVAVYTRPPQPKGRGHIIQKSPIHNVAELHGIPVITPITLRDPEAQSTFSSLQADLAVVAAYGLILPPAILGAPQFGCINVHASLLPQWRGAAPVHRAILAGDTETGVTIMKMDQGLDTGAMLSKKSITIDSEMNSATLTHNLAMLGANELIKVCDDLPHYLKNAEVQPERGITYAHKLVKGEGLINWQINPCILNAMLRALHPWPGCYFDHNGVRIKIIQADCNALDHSYQSGTIIDRNLTIACRGGVITLNRILPANSRPLSGPDFMNGYDLQVGDII